MPLTMHVHHQKVDRKRTLKFPKVENFSKSQPLESENVREQENIYLHCICQRLPYGLPRFDETKQEFWKQYKYKYNVNNHDNNNDNNDDNNDDSNNNDNNDDDATTKTATTALSWYDRLFERESLERSLEIMRNPCFLQVAPRFLHISTEPIFN